MTTESTLIQGITHQLIEIGAIKFGSFTLKSGILSPFYIDLRILAGYPELLKKIALAMAQQAKSLKFDLIAGLPYTALPMATALSLDLNVPLIYCRKEKKDYGTKRLIEGVWESGQRVILIDDLITDGGSKFETIERFESEGLIVQDVLVLIDREQGGFQCLKEKGYRLHSLISIHDIFTNLHQQGKINEQKLAELNAFVRSHSGLSSSGQRSQT